MRIRQLRTFVTVAETGSFIRAAERLNMTQSAVSLQMKAVEDAFNRKLFDRSVRPPTLTSDGRVVLRHARVITSAFDELLQRMPPQDIHGSLAVGAIPSTLTGILPRALANMRARYPLVDILLFDGLSVDLVRRIELGEIDVALISEPLRVKENLQWRHIDREKLVVIAPTGATGDFDQDFLEQYPYLRFNRRAWFSTLVEEQLKIRGITVRETMELETLEAISTMVFFGLGVSIVPERYLNNPFPMPIRCVQFGNPPVTRDIGLCALRDHAKKNLADLLYEELLSLRGSDSLAPGPKLRDNPDAVADARRYCSD